MTATSLPPAVRGVGRASATLAVSHNAVGRPPAEPLADRATSASATPAARHSAAEMIRLSAATFAFGAGLVHLALIADHLEWWAPAGIGIALLALAQLGWSFLLLRADELRLPRLALGVTLGAVAAWAGLHAALVPFGPGTIRGVGWPDAAVLLMQFGVLIALALEFRTRRTHAEHRAADLVAEQVAAIGNPSSRVGQAADARADAPARRGLGTGTFLLVFFALVVLVSTLTTLGLAGTEAGVYAVPHGGHH